MSTGDGTVIVHRLSLLCVCVNTKIPTLPELCFNIDVVICPGDSSGSVLRSNSLLCHSFMQITKVIDQEKTKKGKTEREVDRRSIWGSLKQLTD